MVWARGVKVAFLEECFEQTSPKSFPSDPSGKVRISLTKPSHYVLTGGYGWW